MSTVNKKRKHVDDKFPTDKRSPESTSAERGSRFCRQVVVGVRSREEHCKSGKRPLTPASEKYLKQDILHCSSESVLKRRSPGQLIASFGLQTEQEYTELKELSFA